MKNGEFSLKVVVELVLFLLLLFIIYEIIVKRIGGILK